MKHTLVARVQDQPGVLNRIASLFRRRAFNIESLTVGHSETPDVSRMTIVVDTARVPAHARRGQPAQAHPGGRGARRDPPADRGARARPHPRGVLARGARGDGEPDGDLPRPHRRRGRRLA